MKSKWVFLAVLLISNVLYAQKPESIIVKASVAPVIDGIVDNVWAVTDSNVIDKNFGTDVPTLGDVGTTYWKALWDDEGMYILLVVNDDEWRPAYLTGAADNWMYDKPEIYFDVNYVLTDGLGPSVGQGHYIVSPTAIEGMIDGTPATDAYGVIYSFTVEGPNYMAEYFIPWSLLKDKDGIFFDQKGVMGFDVTIIDKDSADSLEIRRRAVWANVGNIDESWNNMDDCGLITLQGADSTINVETITLTGGNITEDNGNLQIAATILPENATLKTLKWSVFPKEGNAGRATIDQNGLLTALIDGVVVVSATSQDGAYITGTCEVTISGQTPTLGELNLILNGNFDLYDNITKAPLYWGGWIDAGYGDPYAVEGSNVVLNNTQTHPTENWHYQFSQPNLNALPDVPYVVSFVAWAANDRNITFGFEDTAENGYNRYGYSTDPESTGRSEWTFPITTVPTRYTFHVTFDQILPSTIQKITYFISQALGTVYLDSITLISEADLAMVNSYPVLNTVSVNSISSSSVLCESNVISDGGNIITERGVCYNTFPNPTVFDSKIIDGTGTGSFTTTVSGLVSNSNYFFRTYVINAKGTFYGNTLSVYTDDCSNIGMVGTFNNWGNDSTDVLLENVSESPCSWQKVYTFYESGEVKFRKNYDWLINWGGNEFPSGISVQFGPNIPVPAGMYQISFNSNTGEYNFELTESFFNDSLALVALYNATEGSAWNNNENWLDGPLSTWYGVTITENRVSGIYLSQNNLNGLLPAELSQLSALQQLVLWGNNLQGTIPAGLGELSNLVNLDLGINQLSGAIPAEIGNLNNLEYLYLGAGNQLTGTIPSELGQLSKLKILALDRNLLTGTLPVSFGNLDSIQTIFLYSNQFTGALPEEFTNLTNLVYLDIQGNQIDYIPELKNIPTLNHLDCSNNKLTFSDIEKNTGINEFYYSPQANIGEEQYYTLNIGENFVYSIVTGGTQNKYQWYKDGDILANQTTSALEINFLKLTDAGTYYCQVTSDLVPGLVITSQNTNLSVSAGNCYHIGLVGTLNQWGNNNSDIMMDQDADDPCSWNLTQKFDDDGEVKFRRDYNWSVNWGNTGFPSDTASLQGPNIPVPAGTYEITFNSGTGLYNFQVINVSCNLIDSLALVAIYNTTNGPGWGRNDNWLTGKVQNWYGVTVSPEGRVIGLNLASNNLSGYIPDEIGNLTELQRLYFGNNMFVEQYNGWNNLTQQPLPQTISNLTKIQVLSFDGVPMNSELPDVFGGMYELRELYIQDCYFTNYSLPAGIDSCRNLQILNISYNGFSEFPDLSGLNNLLNLQSYGCYFDFADIEPYLWIPQFEYCCQRLLLGNPESLNPTVGETISRTILAGGSSNMYQWLKDGQELAGQNTNTLILENIDTGDAGIYTLRVTSNIAPRLQLSSHPVILYQNQLPVYQSLEAIYNSTNGDNWFNNTNWLSDEPLSNWNGISVNNDGTMSLLLWYNNLDGTLPLEMGGLNFFNVIQIGGNPNLTGAIPSAVGQLTAVNYLSFWENNLTGVIPAEIINCSNLNGLELSGNEFTGLPDLSLLNNLYHLRIFNNQFLFDDIIPLIGNIPIIDYAPQDSIGESQIFNMMPGDYFSYTIETPGDQNQYQWFRDGELIDGQNSPMLEILYLTPQLSGNYYCQVTNSQAPNLTLISRPLTINVATAGNIKVGKLATLQPLPMGKAFCGLSNNESITITIINTGTIPISNFNVGYSVDGNPITEETFTGTINPGDTIDYTFATGVDLTTNEYYKTYTFGLYLVYNDDNPADNSLNRTREVFGNYTDLPHWSTFNSCDGMLSDISFAIAEDMDGNIWSTDFYGASKFDGENWTTYTTADGLGANYSWAMINDKDGNIWFAGATDSVITKYDGTSFTQYPQPGSFEECIYVDSNGNLWFGSWTAQGIAKYDGTSWTYFMNGEVNFGSNIYSIGEDANGNILVSAQENGVPKIMQFDGSTWTDFVIPGNTHIVSEIFFDSKGNTWFTAGSNVFRYDGASWTQFNSMNGTIGYCEDISEDIHGNIWFAGGSEVVKYNGSFWTKYSKEDGLAAANLSLFAMKADSKGNIWAGSNGAGITKYAPSGNIKMLALTSPAPLTNNRAYCGLSDNEPITVSFTNTGDVALSDFDLGYNLNGSFGALETYNGTINPGDTLTHTFASGVDFTTNEYIKAFNFEFYVQIDDDNSDDNLITRTRRVFGDYTDLPNWTTYNSCDGMLSDISFAIAEDKNGNIWSTDFYGASKFDGENWTTYTTVDGLGDNYSWAMINDKDGNIWFAGANDSIITKYDGSAFTQYPQSGKFNECIYQDIEGNLWFGSYDGDGVVKFDGVNWVHYSTAATGLGWQVLSIGEDINGNLYFSTDYRIVKFDGTNWSNFVYPGGDLGVKEIFFDSKGNTWFTANEDYYKFDGENWSHFALADGITKGCEDISEDIYGNIWFGGLYDIAKYDGVEWTKYIKEDGLVIGDFGIYTIHADVEGNIWSGSYLSGISKYIQITEPCPQHYHTVWEGTLGFDHMNINVIGAKYDGLDLEDGDEVGVFDGDICVGYGKVTGTIGLQNILSIKVSRDDGTGNGFTSGNEVTYRIWNCSDSSEYAVQEVTCYDTELNPITCSPFEAGGTSFVELSGKGEECFTLEFRTGWNLFSVPVLMDSTNMMYVFQPMIDSKSLVKIQDELGNSLENWGIFGGWQNHIGEIGLPEGYKIKVNWLDSINVCGARVKYPYAIALQTGWNIIGYPQSGMYDAQEVVQQLIDRKTLVKVQDELGNSLENWGIFGGWQNHIGNLLPGEGYKVKVSAKDTLWIYENYTKSGAVQPELIASTHFRQNYSGNGVDHMNINLVGLPVNAIQAGDELAVFEGEACVGAVTLTQHNIENQSVQLTASAFDGQVAGGFTEGSRFTLKLWSLATGAEYTITPEILSGSATFAKHETTVASLEKYTITGFDEMAGLEGTAVRCYPNPFSESVTIEVNLSAEAEVEVEVLNQLGQVVSQLIPNQRRAAGIHQVVWNGRNPQGQQVTPGMYHLRVSMNESVLHHKVIFSK